MTCPHLTPAYISTSTVDKPVYKDECTRCYLTDKSTKGLDICLKCFNGSCCENLAHTDIHVTKHSHPVVVNLRTVVKNPDVAKEPMIVTKVAVGKAGGIDHKPEEHETFAKAFCYACNKELDKANPLLTPVIDYIVASHSAIESSKITEWEQEIKICKHTQTLIQPKEGLIPLDASVPIHCTDCTLNTNLWFCLTCGHLGCGREGFQGAGGHNHAINHNKATGHPVVVKMGTITPDGKASLYCYACDNDTLDPNLSAHLAPFGIDTKKQVKTEKTMAELELALNLAFSLSQTYEQGFKFKPLYGPSLTGIENVGNTCYIASVLQLLFSLPGFVARYYETSIKHITECLKNPAECFHCQMGKVAYGLCSGVYSQPKKQKKILYEGMTKEEEGKEYFYQEGIRPNMFKTYFGKGNPDYSSNQQQDAALYLVYLLDKIEKAEKLAKVGDPTDVFRFEMEIKIKCNTCAAVKYIKQQQPFARFPIPLLTGKYDETTEVTLDKCLEYFAKDEVGEYVCPKCNKAATYTKSQRFLDFPQVLVLSAAREFNEGMMLKKIMTKITFPEDKLNLEPLKAAPHPAGETVIDEGDSGAEIEPEINMVLLNELMLNGIPELAAKHSLVNTGNSSSELAINWYFDNMSDPKLKMPVTKKKKVESVATKENISMMIDFGYTKEQAEYGLNKTDNNVERAIDYLCNNPMVKEEEKKGAAEKMVDAKPGVYNLHGFITHLGTHANSGHYVAHVKKEGKWVYFNDQKVGQVEGPPVSMGTVYFFVKQ